MARVRVSKEDAVANAEHVSTAESKRTLFFEVMDMTADKFASTFHYGMTVMKFFDLPDSAFVAANKDAVKSVAKWRDLYDAKKYSFLTQLAELALTHLQRPVGSAAVERVFSFLTDMDDTHRRSMKREMLRYVLFLRGNLRVVQELRARYAATYDVAAVAGGSTAPRVGEKRKQQAAAVAGASAALHAASAAGAGAAAAAKRARRESDSSSDDSDEAQFDPAMEDDD